MDAYKPVCAQPNDCDGDGSVLRSMADSLLRFWNHCYGTDGQGGAVAAVTAAAQQALHQLAALPLPAAQGGSSLWCEGLFKGREEVSSAFSVATFLSMQQVRLSWRGIHSWLAQRLGDLHLFGSSANANNPASLCASLHSSHSSQAVEPAVDMEEAVPEVEPEPAVAENNENHAAPPAKVGAVEGVWRVGVEQWLQRMHG